MGPVLIGAVVAASLLLVVPASPRLPAPAHGSRGNHRRPVLAEIGRAHV